AMTQWARDNTDRTGGVAAAEAAGSAFSTVFFTDVKFTQEGFPSYYPNAGAQTPRPDPRTLLAIDDASAAAMYGQQKLDDKAVATIAAAAGIQITWDDMSELSQSVPLITRIYPNGIADVNHFHAAGGMGFLIRELLEGGFLHEDVKTITGEGLASYAVETRLIEDKVAFLPAPKVSALPKVLTGVKTPFETDGGLKVLNGNLGKSVIKVSAVKPEHRIIEAPARVFHAQSELMDAFKNNELKGDMIAVVRFCGPKAIGMPELHKLTPLLGILQDRGLRVALVTDGRMSGASGKVPAAIHVTPEAIDGGAIAKIIDGDLLKLDAEAGTLSYLGDETKFNSRNPAEQDLKDQHSGMGRELFGGFRQLVGLAQDGASIFD
ncbi:MAG: dihydroxy-acid dehydratase, partial [Devosiaceae bacterium]|nr:dihydroxy-acid dehydratase [Devosiaceae bacterium]